MLLTIEEQQTRDMQYNTWEDDEEEWGFADSNIVPGVSKLHSISSLMESG